MTSEILAAVIVVGGGLLLAYLSTGKRMVSRLDDLTARVFGLQDANLKCMEENAKGARREADLKAEVAAQGVRLRAVESATGTAPYPLVPGIVVCDLRGVVLECSPALTPVLHYLPGEVVGRPVEDLVPEDLRPAHRATFARAAADPAQLDPGREELTYALSKLGGRVPVAVTLRGWRVGGEGLITVTIRQRAQGPVPTGGG